MKHIFKVYFLLFIISLSTTSCFECCNGEDFKFRIRLEVLMQQKKTIELFFTDKNNKTQRAKAITDGDFVEFCLNAEPIDIQFTFKGNLKKEKLFIKSLLLENKDNQMFIEKNMIHSYFIPNKGMRYNNEEYSYSFLQGTPIQLKPTLSSRKSLISRLKKRLAL